MTNDVVNRYMQPVEAYDSEINDSILPILEAAANAAQIRYDRMRADTIAAVEGRVSIAGPITEKEFYQLFAALDRLSEEVYLCEEVGIDQSSMYRWLDQTSAPDHCDRQKTLTDILAWVKVRSKATGLQVVARIVQDQGWEDAYPEFPQTQAI